MAGSVYILRVRVPSMAARRAHGAKGAWVWRKAAIFRLRVPDDENGLFDLFLPSVKIAIGKWGGWFPARVSLIRNNAKGEKKGFKAVVYGEITPRHLEIIRRARAWSGAVSLSRHRPIPTVGGHSLGWVRQPQWVRSPDEESLLERPLRGPRLGKFANRLKEKATKPYHGG